jgi:hypothetical protein
VRRCQLSLLCLLRLRFRGRQLRLDVLDGHVVVGVNVDANVSRFGFLAHGMSLFKVGKGARPQLGPRGCVAYRCTPTACVTTTSVFVGFDVAEPSRKRS